jgi:hypothetical protein
MGQMRGRTQKRGGADVDGLEQRVRYDCGWRWLRKRTSGTLSASFSIVLLEGDLVFAGDRWSLFDGADRQKSRKPALRLVCWA